MAENRPLISTKNAVEHDVPKGDQIWTKYYERCQNKVIEPMKFQRSGDSGKRPFWRNKGHTHSLQNEKRNKWAKEKGDMCIWKLEKNRIDKEQIRWEEKKMCSKEADSQGFSLWKDVVHVEGEEAVDENRVQSRTLSLFYFLLF